MKSTTAQAPGKIILSGEHAVLHGCPALAMAINRYATTTVTQKQQEGLDFVMPSFAYQRTKPRKRLHHLMQRVEEAYSDFLRGEIKVKQILKGPFELLEYTAGKLASVLGLDMQSGLEMHTESHIPVGCGLGSSAASIVSLNYALLKFHQRTIAMKEFIQLCTQAENMQHGYSSGLDVRLACYGGYWRVQQEQASRQSSINLPPIALINTGQPLSSTGECVAHTQPQFDSARCTAFTETTNALDNAIKNHRLEDIHKAIRNNHKLLVELGVVPQAIQDIVTTMEARGASAKLCGAGSIAGEHGGALLVVEPAKIETLTLPTHWQMETIQLNPAGVQLV